MNPRAPSPVAAPPDDGGHRGSYTLPEEEIETGGADRPSAPPPLHTDPVRLRGDSDAASPVAMFIAALIFVCVTALFMLGRAWL